MFARRIEPVSLSISALACEVSTFECKRLDGRFPVAVALVKFVGTYRDGSAGAPDARFIRWRLMEACDLLAPAALIVDCVGSATRGGTISPLT